MANASIFVQNRWNKFIRAVSVTQAVAIYEHDFNHTLYDFVAVASRKAAFKAGVEWERHRTKVKKC